LTLFVNVPKDIHENQVDAEKQLF